MHQLCREFVLAKRIAAGLIQIGQPLVLKQQKQESLTCFIRFYLLTCFIRFYFTVGKLDAAEVDFVAFKPEGKIYIQVTYEINNRETEKREYERLLSIKDNYPKYVIRMDDFAGRNYEGVKTMHIADFLLDDSY